MKTSSFVLAAAVIAMLAVSASAVQQLTGDDFDTATAEGAWFVKFYGMWERARVSCISVERFASKASKFCCCCVPVNTLLLTMASHFSLLQQRGGGGNCCVFDL